MQPSSGTPDLDPVTLEVIRSALPAITNEMAVDLQRTSYNMMIYEIRDFCAAIVGLDGALIAQNVGGVSHFIADLGVIILDGLAQYGKDGFAPGDVIITNHQKVAGQHLNNIVIYTPFFVGDELVSFTMVRAHWIDVGGFSTGWGGGGQVTDPWMEGLQLDQIKIYEAGVLNEPVLQILSDNIRYPESSLGDMRSQIAACRLANRRLAELYDKYGAATMAAGISRIFDESEAKCRKWVERIPDGVYEARSSLDGRNGPPLPLAAKVTVKGANMTIDLSGCAPEQRTPINSRTYAAARVAYKALTAPREPVNEGSFRGLEVIIPEGNIMMARYPAPMASWSGPIPAVIDTILAALAPAIPDHIPAAHQGFMGGGALTFFGRHEGRAFMVQTAEGGGWGGRPFEDGESAVKNVCQGDVCNSPMEGIELKNPVVFLERAYRSGSGGPGKYRGGLGALSRMRGLVDGSWNLPRSLRIDCPPWGLWGGLPGVTESKFLKLPGEDEYKLVDVARYSVPAGTEAMVQTSGGGGWGDPLERDAAAVCWDVVEELISREAAHDHYGVVLLPEARDEFVVDDAATRKLRDEMRAGRGPLAESTIVMRPHLDAAD